MNWVRRFHLGFGFLMFVGFLLTGQYMDRSFNHLADMDDLPRALMRAQHLYILLAALINISLGSYLTISSNWNVRSLQLVGSFLVVVATFILTYSFFKELPSTHIERPLCRYGLYIILGGVLCHGIPKLLSLNTKKRS